MPWAKARYQVGGKVSTVSNKLSTIFKKKNEYKHLSLDKTMCLVEGYFSFNGVFMFFQHTHTLSYE